MSIVSGSDSWPNLADETLDAYFTSFGHKRCQNKADRFNLCLKLWFKRKDVSLVTRSSVWERAIYASLTRELWSRFTHDDIFIWRALSDRNEFCGFFSDLLPPWLYQPAKASFTSKGWFVFLYILMTLLSPVSERDRRLDMSSHRS